MPLGSHTFQVKAKGNNGLWGAAAVFHLVIAAETPTFTPTQSPTARRTPTRTATPTVTATDGILTVSGLPGSTATSTSCAVAGTEQVPRVLSVNVRDPGIVERTIALDVDGGGCPMGLAGSPDFDSRTADAQSSILVAAGKTKTAKVPLTIRSSD